jgi:large subunit ribosomal protein L15
MIRLHNMRTRPGSRHRVKRLGSGESSGHGKTSGKGHKGQKARSGGSLRLGFEGGQMPLIRRLPKRGFNNAAFHKNYAIVNLSDLMTFKEGTVVNEQLLRDSNLIRGHGAGLKILGGGELTHSLTVEADKISASAREKIEKAGGTVTMREKLAPHGPRVVQELSPAVDVSEPEAKTAASKVKAATKKPSSKKRAPARAASKKKTSGKS